MSDRKSLLRGVIDNPDDDAPRLVMADWCEEHGEADRAEFIRLQIELVREDVAEADEPLPLLSRLRSYRVGTPDRRRRIERARALYDAHRDEWEADVAAWARRGADFSRGFIAHLDATAAQWLKGAAGLHRAAPVTDLVLTRAAGLMDQLAACPHLARVSSLVMLSPFASPQEPAVLAGSPHLGRLRSLRLISARQGAGLRPLLAAAWPGLLGLLLQRCDVTEAHATELAVNPASGSLLKLSFWEGSIGPAGAEALAESPHLGRLAYLALSHNRVGNSGALALVRSRGLRSLTHLVLWGCGVTAEGAESLAAEPGLGRLRHLDLSEGQVGDAGAAALAGSPHLAGLRRLELRSCNITDAGALALAASPHLGALRTLRLGGNQIEAARARLRERFDIDP
jgi:uncharacterized protein (TIGR02996 family)